MLTTKQNPNKTEQNRILTFSYQLHIIHSLNSTIKAVIDYSVFSASARPHWLPPTHQPGRRRQREHSLKHQILACKTTLPRHHHCHYREPWSPLASSPGPLLCGEGPGTHCMRMREDLDHTWSQKISCKACIRKHLAK